MLSWRSLKVIFQLVEWDPYWRLQSFDWLSHWWFRRELYRHRRDHWMTICLSSLKSWYPTYSQWSESFRLFVCEFPWFSHHQRLRWNFPSSGLRLWREWREFYRQQCSGLQHKDAAARFGKHTSMHTRRCFKDKNFVWCHWMVKCGWLCNLYLKFLRIQLEAP